MRSKLNLVIVAGMFLFLAGCSKEGKNDGDVILEQESITLTSEKTYQLNIKSGGSNDVHWNSNNEYVATVSNTGLVTAHKVGKAVINANTASCQVTVAPIYNLYEEPIVEWGISKEELINRLGDPSSTESNLLGYLYSDEIAPLYGYAFNENNELTYAMVYINTKYTTQLSGFLLERYDIVSRSDENRTMVYLNSFTNVGVFLSLENVAYWLASYAKGPYDKSASTMMNQFNSLFEKMNQ